MQTTFIDHFPARGRKQELRKKETRQPLRNFHWPFPRKGTETLTVVEILPSGGTGLSLTISPQGDGNKQCFTHGKILRVDFHWPFPRKGTETWTTTTLCSFFALLSLTISPQGDGNFHVFTFSKEGLKLSLTISPQGDGNNPYTHQQILTFSKFFHWPFPRKGTETAVVNFLP